MYVVSSIFTVPITNKFEGIVTDEYLSVDALCRGIGSLLSRADKKSEKYRSTWDKFISSRGL